MLFFQYPQYSSVVVVMKEVGIITRGFFFASRSMDERKEGKNPLIPQT